jgi:N-acetylmuramoyl-L-alanine amidase
MATIVLDPGHGGATKIGGSSPNNAVGQNGLLEKQVTLEVAFAAEKLLTAKGHTVVLTRKTDHNLGLADRARAAKSIAAPVFVSIHFNGFNKTTQGTETICESTHSTKSANLCRAMQKRLVAATGYNDRNAGHPGGVKSQPLGVLKSSSHHGNTACCLIEVSFMDVAAEEARLRTAAYIGRVGKAVADGVTDYLGAGETESAAAASTASFEDGFAAEGHKAPKVKLGAPVLESIEIETPSKKAQKKSNDLKEFASVDIGEGFDPIALESSVSILEASGFDMAAFQSFVQSLGLRHFSANELLFLGNSNEGGGACSGKNAFPSRDLWPNIANTARMLDEIRHRLGARCRILSAYRNEAYNNCIGGESASLHMRYNAIDFKCDTGTSSQWHAVAKAVRASSSSFVGGIGKYPSFVHVDTRGYVANW